MSPFGYTSWQGEAIAPHFLVLKLYRLIQFRDWIGMGAGCDREACLTKESPMTVYLIADINVTDGSWVPDYAARVHQLVERHGGRYLSRSGNVEQLEGDQPTSTLVALLQFPSRQAVMAFATDPEYAPFATARQSGSTSRFRLIDDTDLAGTIPYLAAG